MTLICKYFNRLSYDYGKNINEVYKFFLASPTYFGDKLKE